MNIAAQLRPGEAALSILVPSLRERMDKLCALYDKLNRQAQGLPVEILVLLDNRTRTIGAKRQSLLEQARGRFVVFVDDDDDVLDGYVYEITNAILHDPTVDVVVFDQLFTHNGSDPVRIVFDIGHKVDSQVDMTTDPAARRRPWHVMAWRRVLAQQGRFSERNYGEDADWVDQVAPLAVRQTRIERALSLYRYDDAVSEAKQ